LDYKNHWGLRQFYHCQVLMLVHCLLFASHYPLDDHFVVSSSNFTWIQWHENCCL
jgi:hypothetical protein